MKTIDSTLVTHLALPVTTWCLLVRVECVGTFAGTILGFTNLDIDVIYNDGAGAVTYKADNGFTPRRFSSTSALKGDDSEIDGVIAADITEQKVRAGIFDSAKVTVYRVNYNDLTTGRHEVMAHGKAGQTVYTAAGWRTEFWPLSKWLSQPIGEPYSLTCNAQFGDARCGVALSWASGTVTSLGAETDRIFSCGLAPADNYYKPGVVEWLTGNNAGAQSEVDANTGGAFTLALALPYAIVVGDTFRVRRDCDKLFATCKDTFANTLNFRGQNLIPVDGTAMVPGAEITRA